MKIVFITYNLKIGGAQKAIVKIANLSRTNKNKVTLICLTEEGEIRKLLHPSIDFILLGKKNLIKSIPTLYFHLNKIQPQIVFSTLFMVNLVVVLLKQFGFINSKVIIREETTPGRVDHFKIKDKFIFKLCKLLFKKSDVFVAPSVCALEDSINTYKLNPQKSIYIPNPVLKKITINKRSENISNKDFKLLFVGRISKEKRIELQIKTLAQLNFIESYNFQLYLVGPFVDQLYKEDLFVLVENLKLNNKVFFEGQQIDVQRYYKLADIFLLTSQFEGFPSVIVEALGEGLKVVASDCKSGPREILNNGKFGSLIKDYSPESIANSILLSIKKEIDHEELNKHLLQYSLKAVQKSYLSLFETLN